MFQFPRFPPQGLCVQPSVTGSSPAGFPHSDIAGSVPAHGSPTLFAVYHVLLRLFTPRHPPFAFFRFALSCGDRACLVLVTPTHGYHLATFLHDGGSRPHRTTRWSPPVLPQVFSAMSSRHGSRLCVGSPVALAGPPFLSTFSVESRCALLLFTW